MKSRAKQLYWWKFSEETLYDGEIKINHNSKINPEINLNNKTEVRNTIKNFSKYIIEI